MALPPIGTPFLADGGRVTEPWLAYFRALANPFSAAQPQTVGVVMSFASALSPVVTGASPVQIQVSGNQAGLDLWDVSSGAVTPAGGSRWRIWADNVGGGGGALTFGFVDVANARIAAGFDNAGVLNLPFGLNVSNPANITLGSGWLNWTPTVTAAGSMTVSGVTVTDAQYLRVGPLVFFKAFLTFTLGGTASVPVYVTTPINVAAGAQNAGITVAVQQGGVWAAGWGFYDTTNRFMVYTGNSGNYALGSTSILIEGFFRA